MGGLCEPIRGQYYPQWNLDKEVEVDVKMLPPEPEDPAPLLGGQVERLDTTEDTGPRPPCPRVILVSAHKGPNVS